MKKRYDAGIEFAYRNVTVYLPPGADGPTDAPDRRTIEAGAAAALAAEPADRDEEKKPS